jgi:uncharacterized membrane protein
MRKRVDEAVGTRSKTFANSELSAKILMACDIEMIEIDSLSSYPRKLLILILRSERQEQRYSRSHRRPGISFKTRRSEMSDLIAIVYPTEAKAEEVRQRLFKLQKEYLITLSDAVIVTKNDNGQVKLNQLVNTTATGAVSGSFWGLLIGVIFLNPILGVALGAASGALGGLLADYGINDAFMKDLGTSLKPGNAALFVLVKNMTPDKVLREIQDAGGTVLKTSLDDTKEQQLRDALAKASTETPAAPA